MSEPKAGEVWSTKAGNHVLIVETPESSSDDLGMIWYDVVGRTLVVSLILERLHEKTIFGPNLLMTAWMQGKPRVGL